jgi:DNA-binding transcriptional LysR family regulator
LPISLETKHQENDNNFHQIISFCLSLRTNMTQTRLEHLRIKQLKFVSMLASLGSLAATADRLSMSASAASMMLKEIETIFGAKLFQRQGRGMAPTAQGQALLPRCQSVLGEVSAMGESLAECGLPLLRIGAFPHTTNTALPSVVQALTAGAKPWRLQIVSDSAERLTDKLCTGNIDLMIGQLPRPAATGPLGQQLAHRVLYQSRLCVVGRRQHPLTHRSAATLQESLNWPWILPGMQSTTRTALIDVFFKLGLPAPTPVVESPSFFYSLSLLANSDFLTCCAKSAAMAHGEHARILPFDLGLDPTPVALIWRKSSVEAVAAVEQLKGIDLSSHAD